MSSRLNTRNLPWFDRALIGVMVGSVALLMIALFAWQIPLGSRVQLQEGAALTRWSLSKRITYDSQVLIRRGPGACGALRARTV
ncbi:MAG: hypothetical protein R2838_11665 [Caldilineaceae bacterium]